MADDDDMGDLERGDGVFDRCRGAVLAAVGGVGRDQVGDVAVDEELALIGAEDGGDMHAAVTARDDHRAGVLAFLGEVAIPGFVVGIGGGLPAFVTLDEVGGQGRGGGHCGLLWRVWDDV